MAYIQSLKNFTETNEDLTKSRSKLYSREKKSLFQDVNSPKLTYKANKVLDKVLTVCFLFACFWWEYGGQQ